MSGAPDRKRGQNHLSALPTLVILGPTAGGKSELAVALAEQFHGEIISADSMQVYRELNAGTAKPTAAQRARAPHHLIDIVEPTDPFSVAEWLERAEAILEDLRARGKLPIVVGGTNLYIKALLEGMFEGPGGDEKFRASLAGTPAPQLHDRLKNVDPPAADRIHPNDRKRITRALEVHHITGRPISEQQGQWNDSFSREPAASEGSGTSGRDQKESLSPEPQPLNPSYRHNPLLIGLSWPVPAINRRINARAKAMFHPPIGDAPEDREDLIDETRRLLDAGRLGPQARQAIGTKQVLAHLTGRDTAKEAMERVKIDTRRFAKNQRTWLKRYRNVHWIEAADMTPEKRTIAATDIVRSCI